MDLTEPLTAQVIRVPREDTLLIRTWVPPINAAVNLSLVLEGVRCEPAAKQEIVDWCEIHADFERLRLITSGWVRDSYGRLLGDLADLQSGETLTGYLLEQHAAAQWPTHYLDVLTDMMTSPEPEQ
jgi:hypothetical protein